MGDIPLKTMNSLLEIKQIIPLWIINPFKLSDATLTLFP